MGLLCARHCAALGVQVWGNSKCGSAEVGKLLEHFRSQREHTGDTEEVGGDWTTQDLVRSSRVMWTTERSLDCILRAV